MKRALFLLILFLTLLIAFTTTVQAVSCPVDGSSSYFTGQTQTIDGVLFHQYKCPQGHVFWARAAVTLSR